MLFQYDKTEIMIKYDLPGLPTDDETLDALQRLRKQVEKLGVKVVDNPSEADHARFVGIFEDNTITIYPNLAPTFALWFTVAHLFGHMTQLCNKTPRVQRANELVLRLKHSLTAEDIQTIYDHEREAAEIGRALISEVENKLPLNMEIAYSRFFHADFRYLINFIETGEQGVEVFGNYWRREPISRDFIASDPRPIAHMSEIPHLSDRIIVV